MFIALARWVTNRPGVVLLIAIALTGVAVAFGTPLSSRLTGGSSDFDTPGSSSMQASATIERATHAQDDGGLLVMVPIPYGPTAPASRALVDQVAALVGQSPDVLATQTVYSTGDTWMLSRDGRATYVVAQLHEDSQPEHALNDVEHRLRGIPGVTVGGSPAADAEVVQTVEQDLARAELLVFPVLFLLSLWIFRSLIASALPVVMGALNIVVTLLVLRGVNEAVHLSVFALNLVTGLGLGLAIDYSLLVVSRYRVELAAGATVQAALLRTVDTAGRTIVFSAATVSASLAALLVFRQRFLYSMAIGGAVVALLAAIFAVVVLPALLQMLGRRLDILAPRRWQRALEQPDNQAGWWFRWARRVVRRRIIFALTAAVILLGLGSFAFEVQFTFMSASELPHSATARQVDDQLRADFVYRPQDAVNVVVSTRDPSAVDQLRARLTELPGQSAVLPPTALGPGTWLIEVGPAGSPLAGPALTLVADIRALDTPQVRVWTSGQTSAFVDMRHSLVRRLPIAIGLICLANLLVLMALTRSLVLPFKSLIMSALTIAATFGCLVLVFQRGYLAGLFGTTGQGALDMTQPILLFALVFGLSTDYGVFLLAAIKEARERSGDREAIILGMGRTGRIVTAAALLFCVTLAALTTSHLVFIKELGFGTALGVLIDATIVRAMLVPSLMAMLGALNWAAPRWLRHHAPAPRLVNTGSLAAVASASHTLKPMPGDAVTEETPILANAARTHNNDTMASHRHQLVGAGNTETLSWPVHEARVDVTTRTHSTQSPDTLWLDQAMTAFQEALGLLDHEKDPGFYGVVLHDMACVYKAKGNHDKAIETFRGSVNCKQRAGDSADLATTLIAFTGLLIDNHELTEARTTLDQLKKLLVEEDAGGVEPCQRAVAVGRMGALYERLGDEGQEDGYTEALRAYESALKLADADTDPESYATLLRYIGDVRMAQGQTRKAVTAYEDAVQHVRRSSSQREQASILFALGRARLQAGYDQQASREPVSNERRRALSRVLVKTRKDL
jgi:uncharacterized membrane protein YdfJ with MMPL/SSD domain